MMQPLTFEQIKAEAERLYGADLRVEVDAMGRRKHRRWLITMWTQTAEHQYAIDILVPDADLSLPMPEFRKRTLVPAITALRETIQ